MSVMPAPMEILQATRLHMHLGRSVGVSLRASISGREDDFSKGVRVWLLRLEAGQDHRAAADRLPVLNTFPQRRHLLDVLERGMRGASIDRFLEDLEQEFFFTMENEFKKKLQLLPIKMLMPLTLCILPGVMILIAAPFLFAMKGV